MSTFKDTYAVETESDLSGLNKAKDGLDSFAGAATGAVAAIGGLAIVQSVTGFITDSITAGFEFEQQLNRIAGATGATGEELEEMKDIARDVWEQGFGTAPEEVINAMTQVAGVTHASGDELKSLTENALAFSATFGTDVTESTRAANQMMTQFGISGEEAFDLLAFTMQNAGDPAGDFLDTIQEYSSIFAEMGLTSDQVINALMNAQESGVFGFDKSADAMREFTIRFKEGTEEQEAHWNTLIQSSDDFAIHFEDGSTRAITSFDQLRLEVANGNLTIAEAGDMMRTSLQGIEDETTRAAIATSLIGTQYEDLGEDILGAFTVGSIGDYTESMDKVKQSTLNAISPTEKFKRSMQGFISQAVNPLIAAVIEELVPALDSFTEWLKGGGLDGVEAFASSLAGDLIPIVNDVIDFVIDLSEQFIQFVKDNPEIVAFVQKVAVSLGIAYAAFVSIGAIVATVSGVIGGLGAGLGVLGAALAFILSPIGLLVGAIALLALAYQTNFLGFKDAVGEAIDYIVPKLGELYGWFIETGLPAIKNAIDDFKNNVWTPLKDALGTIWDTVSPALQALYGWFIETGLPIIQTAITTYMNEYITPMIALMLTIWDTVSPAFNSLYGWFMNTGLPAIMNNITSFKDSYITPMIELVAGIWAGVSVGLGLFKNWFTESGVPAITDKIQEIVDKFNAMRDRANTIWDAISTAMNSLKTNFANIFSAMLQPVQDVIDIVESLISTIGNIKFPSAPDWVSDIGGMIPGVRGLTSGGSGVIGAEMGQGFAAGSGGSGGAQGLVVHSHLYMDGREIMQAVERAKAESPSGNSRPIPLRITQGYS